MGTAFLDLFLEQVNFEIVTHGDDPEQILRENRMKRQ
jgi:hypothetical protein